MVLNRKEKWKSEADKNIAGPRDGEGQNPRGAGTPARLPALRKKAVGKSARYHRFQRPAAAIISCAILSPIIA
jgi:hypothetical protein